MDIKTATPSMTAYQTILLIFSELVKKGKTILSQDKFVENLYREFLSTTDEDTKSLFEDISFHNHWTYVTSVDIEDSLCMLQTYGAIGRLNPAYEKIVIYISSKDADKFIKSYDKKFAAAANKVADDISEKI